MRIRKLKRRRNRNKEEINTRRTMRIRGQKREIKTRQRINRREGRKKESKERKEGKIQLKLKGFYLL